MPSVISTVAFNQEMHEERDTCVVSVMLSEAVITILIGATLSLEMGPQWEEDGGERIVRCALLCLRRSRSVGCGIERFEI